jgi:uncharacterized membrane protein
MKSREIRELARETLGGSIFSSEWMKGLLAYILLSLVNGAVAGMSMGLLSILVTGPLTFGFYSCFLQLARKQHTEVAATVFGGFEKDFINSVGTSILINLAVAVGSFFFVIPGIIVQLMLSMTFYIRADHPEYSILDAMGKSANMMRGNKWRLFKLYFSFIGWHIISTITFGLGYLWIAPYIQTAEATFYKSLVDGEEVESKEEFQPQFVKSTKD